MSEPRHILDFCGHCGSLLSPGLGRNRNPTCENCGEDVTSRTNRIQGTFDAEEAKKLNSLFNYEGPDT